MESIMAEMPLTIFTTLVPFGAGAFIAFAVYCGRSTTSPNDIAHLSRIAAIPLAVVAVAFVAAFFHLASPLHAFWVLAGIGKSPLTNEIVAGVAFFVVALIVCILGATQRIALKPFKALIAIAGALGLAFALLMGSAYSVDTVATWNSPFSPAIAAGEAFASGTLLALLSFHIGHMQIDSSMNRLFAIFIAAGTLVAIACELTWFAGIGGHSTALVDAAALATQNAAPVSIGCLCLFGAAILGIYATLKNRGVATLATATACSIVGVFLLRVAFYALRVSVGL